MKRGPALARGRRAAVFVTAALGLCAPAVRAEVPLPKQFEGVVIDDRRGATVPLDLPFTDHEGHTAPLREAFKAGRPVLLTLNYYSCATLCSTVLNGVLDGLKGLAYTPGNEYQIVTVSINPTEGPALAKAKRATYLEALGRKVPDHAWPFLTGREADVKALADAVGFRYKYDAPTKQYAHGAALYVLTPAGKVSQILYGIQFPARDLRLALVEASAGGIGSPMDKLLLYCFHYDPEARRYLITPLGVMRIGGALTALVLATFLTTFWRRERRNAVVHG